MKFWVTKSFWRLRALPLTSRPYCVQVPKETHPTRGSIVVQRLKSNVQSTKSTRVVQELADDLTMSHQTALRYLSAMGEACSCHQMLSLEHVLRVLWTLRNVLRTNCFVYRQAYDESPLKSRILLSPEADQATTQVGRIHVVESTWAIAVQFPRDDGGWKSFILRGSFSPTIRAANAATGQAIAAVLQQSPQPPNLVNALFDLRIRIAETDQCAANMKAERMWQAAECKTWAVAHFMCIAHKLHAIAAQTWDHNDELLSGLVHTCLAVQTSPQLSHIVKVMEKMIEKQCTLLQGDRPDNTLTEAAVNYRSQCLQAFLPPVKQRKKAFHSTSICECLQWQLVGDQPAPACLFWLLLLKRRRYLQYEMCSAAFSAQSQTF